MAAAARGSSRSAHNLHILCNTEQSVFDKMLISNDSQQFFLIMQLSKSLPNDGIANVIAVLLDIIRLVPIRVEKGE